MNTLLTASIAASSLTLPQIASAQRPPPAQNQQSVQSRVKTDLEQAGFTNVQIMPSPLLVPAKDKYHNPVMMVIDPKSVTSVTEISGGQPNPMARESATNGAASSNIKLSLRVCPESSGWIAEFSEHEAD
jgi:hypothetical protein